MTDLAAKPSENQTEPDLQSSESVSYDLQDPTLYINRELSLLEFQRRVFEEARDRNNPLLERLKFLAIVDSNLEEFFMVRVGGLKMQKSAGVTDLSIDGLTPDEQLNAIRKEAAELLQESRIYLQRVLMPALDEQGIHFCDYYKLTPRQREDADAYFYQNIFPVLTPLAYDPGHPFPHISNLSLNLAVVVQDQDGEKRFARIKVPPSLPPLVPLKTPPEEVRNDGSRPNDRCFVWLVQLIVGNLDRLFPGMLVLEAHPFHVTRNADMQIQELEALDLLDMMETSVRRRRFGQVVRLMVTERMPQAICDILQENLRVKDQDVYTVRPPLVVSSLMQMTRQNRHDLVDKPFIPVTPTVLREYEDDPASIFSIIRRGNILLHHPYESFNPVVNFLRAAAHDPNVLAIKQTLYRVGNASPVVEALLEAVREYGKQVAVLVELKARFDEESNIGWSKMLEQEGVHVTYGLLGLKTHSKIALVVRKEGDHIRRYVHLATGNYNHVTARLYEDLSMFTADDAIGSDATDLFNYLTGYSNKADYQKLLVAPINLRAKLENLIYNEIELARQGQSGHMILKTNALVDKPMIALLYEASQAGVQIDLLVRGMCSLRPGIPGLSENIRVRSIVGRFLEHSRIYYFQNGGDEKIYMGSADVMPRNLNERVEVLFPVEDARMIRHVRDEILATYLRDNTKARVMNSDGTYTHIEPGRETPLNAQEHFINLYHNLNP
jgi:polyphosphate kinase